MIRNKVLAGLFISFSVLLDACNSNNPADNSKGTDFDIGKAIYSRTCITCHLANGKGIESTFPPLAKSDFLARSKTAAIVQVIKGKAGAMIVNGSTYNNIMPPQGLSDVEVAQVLTYVYGNFGNNSTKVSAADVKIVRTTLK